MKKLAIITIVFLIIMTASQTNISFSLLDYFSGEYTAYTETEETSKAIDLGFCYMNSQPVSKNLVGESIKIENLEVSSALKTLNARVIKTEYLDDGTTIIYAFSNLISDHVNVCGENVNLQIAQKEDCFIIGWPLILGSY